MWGLGGLGLLRFGELLSGILGLYWDIEKKMETTI